MKWTVSNKISVGFVTIGVILLLSSLVAIYEFISMRRTIYYLVSDNITSIRTSNMMIEATDGYNIDLLQNLGRDSSSMMFPDYENDRKIPNYLAEVVAKYTTPEERAVADSVQYAYTAYIQVIKDAKYVWRNKYQYRRNWYFNKLYPVYKKLRGYIQRLTVISQESLVDNSRNLSDSFYRSLMPCVVSVVIGIVLIFLFNYFMRVYFVKPILSISKGIKDYLENNKTYKVDVDNDDELAELNSNVEKVVNSNKSYMKKFGRAGDNN
ncbi:MAG: hypothetical protein LKI53_06495 [Bacteroidales bacterium]|jgi:methyl-accepting chemotaxis protein|nr:hypothetical protein [Bacteroidales bacterium]